MNWYKKAVTESTMPYFQEFETEGDYVPNIDEIRNKLQSEFNVQVESDIDCGDSGCSYSLSDGRVLKVTTNDSEGRVAQWLIQNPHQNIIKYYNAWKDGDLWYIIMDWIEQSSAIQPLFNQLESILDTQKCYEPSCAIRIISRLQDFQFKGDILSYLQHLKQMPGYQPFDFLNGNNVGIENEQLKFFDIT